MISVPNLTIIVVLDHILFWIATSGILRVDDNSTACVTEVDFADSTACVTKVDFTECFVQSLTSEDDPRPTSHWTKIW